MNVVDAIMQRRSIRKFTNKPIRMSTLEKLVDCARVAPSGMNRHLFEYIIVNVKDLNEKIFACTEWKNYSFESGPLRGEEPTAYIIVLSKGSSSVTSADVGFAIENILLGAVGEELGSCCLGAINREAISRLLNIPKNYYVCYVIAIGYPKQIAKIVEQDNEKISSVNGIILVSKPMLSTIVHRNSF
jgi:nitroreductase